MKEQYSYRVEYEYLDNGKTLLGYQNVTARNEEHAVGVMKKARRDKGYHYPLIEESIVVHQVGG